MSAKSAPQLFLAQHSRSARANVRDTLTIFAFALLTASSFWMLQRPQLTAHVTGPTAEVDALPALDSPALGAEPEAAPPPINNRHRALSEFLSKRYKVSQAVTLDFVSIAHAAGQQIGLDPLLIIAVMAVESRFNPIAESVAGAKGLMQIIPKYHTAKFREHGAEKSVFDPRTNILVGSQILKEYLSRTGSLDSALQLYVGSSSDEDETYSGKVMSEKQRLQQVLRKPPSRPDVRASLTSERVAVATTPQP